MPGQFEEEAIIENMEYFTQRLQCTDAEKDACLETVVKLFWLRYEMSRSTLLRVQELAVEEPDPFFRACLTEFLDVCIFVDICEKPKELERRFNQYLMAGDYWGGAFLNAVLISQGLVLLYKSVTCDGTEWGAWFESWGDVLGGALRGYFGAEYREKVTAVIEREKKTMEVIQWNEKAREAQKVYPSLLREFDKLTKLSPQQRDWLVRHVTGSTLLYALKVGGSKVSKFLMEGMEDREKFESDLDACNVHAKDAEAAQREILEKAKEIPECI